MRKRQFLLISIMLMLVFIFTSCNNNSTNDSNTSDTPSDKVVSNMMKSDVGTDGDDKLFGSEIKRKEIYSITFLDTQEDALENSFDISEKQDKSVLAWGVENTKEEEAFYDLYIASNGKVCAPTSCEALFAYYYNLHTIEFNQAFDTSHVTNMSYMFKNCYSMENVNLSAFNTSNVTNMSYLFEECASIENVDLSKLDTSKVTDMSYMFYSCDETENLNVTNLDTSKVTNMSYMFGHCSSLIDLDVSNWDTSNVKKMDGMFIGCDELPQLDFSNWNVKNVESYDNFGQEGLKK